MFNTTLSMEELEAMKEEELYECIAAYEEYKKRQEKNNVYAISKGILNVFAK